jgi:hypothetical protein
MASLKQTSTSRHNIWCDKFKPVLEKHFKLLPSMTYHDVLGNESDNAWSVRKAQGSLALSIRCQNDLLLINKHNYMFACDIKVSNASSFYLEAFPIIHHILNSHEVFYIYVKPDLGITHVIHNQELKESQPTKLVVVTDNGYDYEDLIMKAKAIWPSIKIEKKVKKDIKGSGDHFLAWDQSMPVMDLKEGFTTMQNLGANNEN